MTEPRTYSRPAQEALRQALGQARAGVPVARPAEDDGPMPLPDAVTVLTERLAGARRYRTPVVAVPAAALAAALDRMSSLLADATTEGEEMAWPCDAGEYAARWNAVTHEQREEWLAALIADAEAARRCLAMNHAGQLDRLRGELDEARSALTEARRGPVITSPGARKTDPATSHAAAAHAAGVPRTRNQLGRLLLAYLREERTESSRSEVIDGRRAADAAMTSEEAADRANVSLRSEYAKRCSDLVAGGYLQVAKDPDGRDRVRPGASGLSRLVFELTDKGRETARSIEVVAL